MLAVEGSPLTSADAARRFAAEPQVETVTGSVEDVLARRTRSLLLNAKASIEAAASVAQILAQELGQDQAWQATQVTEYQALAKGYVFAD